MPSALEPTRPAEELQPPAPLRSEPTPSIPLVRAEELAPQEAETLVFTLREVHLQGAAALRTEALRDIWAPLIGREVSVATLFDVVNAITRRYSEEGYALSLAVLPEQNIENGVVNLRVVEGYVNEVNFTGDASPDGRPNEYLTRYAYAVQDSRPLRTADLERYLLLMNDLPGITATATFSASSEPGASIMTVDVSHLAREIDVGVNNHLTESLGRTRAGGSVTLNALRSTGDRIRLDAWRGVSNSGYAYVAADYSRTIGGKGLQLSVLGGRSNSEPDTGLLANLDYLGESAFFSATADYPLIRARQRNLSVSSSLGVTNATSDLLDSRFTRDRTRTFSAAVSYDFADVTGAVSMIRFGLTEGLDAWGATRPEDSLKSRSDGSGQFTTADLLMLRNQPLSDRLTLYLHAQAQNAVSDALLSAAECTYGGRILGRGYDMGSLNGDDCVMASAELRWTHSLASGSRLQWYAFVDSGKVSQEGELQPGEERTRKARSSGGGVRGQFASGLIANVEAAKPSKSEYTASGKDSTFVHASLTWRF